ncbi:choline/ethanolamine kinase family protein [Solirhodobacter olei]|uniref:choline/ethanolamine kinase family protein n=1 Tax=Solirhodobacter olei TaxID=2493082 RepID=UPI000FDB3F4B|nr:choline/ethanolamine kinase family protein [Solirhodobacter olei]
MTIERLRSLPLWQGRIQVEPLAGGLSNVSWKVTDRAGVHVVRFGTDYPFHHIDRQREVIAARAAHEGGFGPEVEYAAPGVMVSAFLEARTWSAADVVGNPERIGRLLRAFHRDMPPRIAGPGYMFWVFHVIRDYARMLAATARAGELPRYLALGAELEAAQIPLPVVFGHHDLLPANILDDGESLWLIDYEYAGLGTAMFDLAGASSNAGMTAEQSLRLLSTYLGHEPGRAFLRAFSAMQCASLLREAMWAMVSELHLATPGVDFAAYAQENLDRLAEALDIYRSGAFR